LRIIFVLCKIEADSMDTIKGFIVWPFYIVATYSLFWTAVIINIPSLIIRISSKGARSISKIGGLYDFCETLPLGKTLMSGAVSVFAPYSSSVGAYVDVLTTDTCTVIMYDYPWLRNPFSSLHAVALANVGEMASGIAMMKQLEIHSHLRGIPVKISTEYYKKARGTITGKGSASLTGIDKDCEKDISASLYDTKGELVAKCTVTWSLRMKSPKSK